VPNEASVHLYSLQDAVNLYTKVMDLWQVYEASLPIKVHYVRYEDIPSDFKGTVGNLLKFLDVPWDDTVLSYDKKVKEKANVISPSYSQVSEKIYDRAKYRWLAYREHLEPYLEQLRPYAERFGYDVD
jgi:Sulfotransferase domain